MGEFEQLEDDAYGVAKHTGRDIAAAFHRSSSALRSMASGLVTELEARAARAGSGR